MIKKYENNNKTIFTYWSINFNLGNCLFAFPISNKSNYTSFNYFIYLCTNTY